MVLFLSLDPTSLKDIPLVILGTGFTGRYLFKQAIQDGWRVWTSSRQPSLHLSNIPPDHHVRFDLSQPETWEHIPRPAHFVWCFPATPLSHVQGFVQQHQQHIARMVVLGSTSAYVTTPQPVTEQNQLHSHLPRVQGEEFLRRTLGAIIIRLAGLYGPERHVLNWIRRGKIPNTPSWVNLLHVEDAAAICLQALERAPEGESYIASDGTSRLWSAICQVAHQRWNLTLPLLSPPHKEGKQVSNHKLLSDLHYTIRHPDLFQSLADIELSGGDPSAGIQKDSPQHT